jgi:hypothetical protein
MDRTSPSDPRIVTRYTTVTLPFSANITSRISPHHPAKKDFNRLFVHKRPIMYSKLYYP